MAKKPVKKTSKKAAPKKVTKKHPFLADKPNKEVKKPINKGTVKITNISPHPINRDGVSIPVGKTGMVTPYEAELLTRKKLAK